MKAFLDTSVLVPVFLGDHIHHPASLDLFTRYDKHEAGCGAHSLVEVYSTLTRMPGKHRVNGDQAMLFIEDIRKRFTVVALDPDEVADMLRQSAAGGILGGSVYDALLARCALKARAKALFSWNIRHYERLGPEVVRILQRP